MSAAEAERIRQRARKMFMKKNKYKECAKQTKLNFFKKWFFDTVNKFVNSTRVHLIIYFSKANNDQRVERNERGWTTASARTAPIFRRIFFGRIIQILTTTKLTLLPRRNYTHLVLPRKPTLLPLSRVWDSVLHRPMKSKLLPTMKRVRVFICLRLMKRLPLTKVVRVSVFVALRPTVTKLLRFLIMIQINFKHSRLLTWPKSPPWFQLIIIWSPFNSYSASSFLSIKNPKICK